MAYDSNRHYYEPTDTTHRTLPPEYQTCGRCLELHRMQPETVGTCCVVRGLGVRYAQQTCDAQNFDGTPAFVPLRDLTEGWIYPGRKRIPYSTNTEL